MNILGISGGFGHDAAAALVIDGMVVGACEEERFTRHKRALRQPAMHSVQACLDLAGMSVDALDCIAIGWNPQLALHDRRLQDSLIHFLSSQRFVMIAAPEIVPVSHHLSHAALGYFTSGFDNAAVLVADGQGEDFATTIYRAQGTTIHELRSFGIPDSLGFFYAAVTRYLGFSAGSAGKTMGLAPMGSIAYDFPEIELLDGGYQIRMPGDDKTERMSNWMRLFEQVFGPPAASDFRMDTSTGLMRASAPLAPHLRNAAASAQSALERTLRHLGDLALDLAGGSNLVLSGGVALNCSANGRLRQTAGGADMFVSGAVNDGGTALGAALAVAAEHGELTNSGRWRNLFTGPEFDPGSAIVRARRLGLVVRQPGDGIESAVSRLLADEQVGGWFRGRAEYGPRALGGRSIIARCDLRDVSARVNAIKGRESWRPLAPAMNSATAAKIGIDGEGLDFMVEARWLPDSSSHGPLAGVVHVDNSVRPLVVDNSNHPFASLLAAIQDESGSGACINTSFNQEYEPIVNSPMDALRTFVASDLDFLILDDTLLAKPRSEA